LQPVDGDTKSQRKNNNIKNLKKNQINEEKKAILFL
jgi:hypothetical protein